MKESTLQTGIAGSRPAGPTARSRGDHLPAIPEVDLLLSEKDRGEVAAALAELRSADTPPYMLKVIGAGVVLICPSIGLVKNWSFASSANSHEFAEAIERYLAA